VIRETTVPDQATTPLSAPTPPVRPKDGAILLGYALFEGVWSLGIAIFMVLTPSNPDTAFLLGLSPSRFAVTALVVISGILSFAGAVALRRSAASYRLLARSRNAGLWLGLAAILVGATIVIIYVIGAGAFPELVIGRLAPLGVWLLVSGVALAATLFAGMERPRTQTVAYFASILAIGLTGILINTRAWPASESKDEDIYYVFLEGQRLVRGENPYERVLGYELHQNVKFPHNLPLFYHLAAAVQWLGLGPFEPWIAMWRLAFLLANLVIAVAIFHAYWRAGNGALGAVGSLLWLANRWTLHVSQTGDYDFLALSFLVVSAVVLASRPRASLVLFGISVAIRHLAVGLAPIWLITTWRTEPSTRRRVSHVLLMASVPILTALPLFLRSPNGLFRAIINTWTRPPQGLSVYTLPGIPAVMPSILIVAILIVLYVAVGQRRLPVYAASMLALATMIFLTSVFFTSYMIWLIPFIPLAALEAASRPHAIVPSSAKLESD
jgi:hypothetical protein